MNNIAYNDGVPTVQNKNNNVQKKVLTVSLSVHLKFLFNIS